MKKIYVSVLCLFLCIPIALPAHATAYSRETTDRIAHAVAAECPDASFGVQIALSAVILHRMERYGLTAAQVIWSADFLACTDTGRIALPPEEKILAQTRAAVEYAIAGLDPTGGALGYGGGDTGRSLRSVWYADGGYLFGE